MSTTSNIIAQLSVHAIPRAGGFGRRDRRFLDLSMVLARLTTVLSLISRGEESGYRTRGSAIFTLFAQR